MFWIVLLLKDDNLQVHILPYNSIKELRFLNILIDFKIFNLIDFMDVTDILLNYAFLNYDIPTSKAYCALDVLLANNIIELPLESLLSIQPKDIDF